jgi:NarL family two-component system response regulator LiaR
MSGRDRIRVLLVDDHAIVRDGIRSLLATEKEIEVVGEADNGRDGISMAEQLQPDVILMDLVMPEVDGIEATRCIIADQPKARILVLTSFDAEDKVFPAIKAGAMGYLLKDSDSEDLVRAIHQVDRGESSLDPKIARMVLREMWGEPRPETQLRREQGRDPGDEQLTEREVQVLQLVARGLSNEEIAQRLVVAERTVRTHVSNILGKLHLANRTQATLYALREGLASLDEPS